MLAALLKKTRVQSLRSNDFRPATRLWRELAADCQSRKSSRQSPTRVFTTTAATSTLGPVGVRPLFGCYENTTGLVAQRSQRGGVVAPRTPARSMVITVEISESEFHNMANDILVEIQDQLEEQEDSNPGLEVEASGDGVINIKIAGKGHWVINKQTPSRQIWLSSPLTGPTHYKWEGSQWVCTKDGHQMVDRLKDQLNVDLSS